MGAGADFGACGASRGGEAVGRHACAAAGDVRDETLDVEVEDGDAAIWMVTWP